jgi:glycosyltransferase involved in cell wall biosynthesis
MGLPVVSTSLGCEGLSVANGHHLLICDEPEQFAYAVVQLVANAALRKALRSQARRLIEDRYQWQSVFQKLETEMLSLVDSSGVTIRAGSE